MVAGAEGNRCIWIESAAPVWGFVEANTLGPVSPVLPQYSRQQMGAGLSDQGDPLYVRHFNNPSKLFVPL